MMSILENVEVRVCEIWFEHILSVHFRMAHAAPCISLIHGFTDLHISTYERFHHVLVMRPWRASPSRPTGPSLPASLSLSPSRYLSLSPARASTHASPPPPVAARPSVSHLLTFLRFFAYAILTSSSFAPSSRHLSAARHAEPQRDRQPHRGRGRRHRQRGTGSDGHRWAS